MDKETKDKIVGKLKDELDSNGDEDEYSKGYNQAIQDAIIIVEDAEVQHRLKKDCSECDNGVLQKLIK